MLLNISFIFALALQFATLSRQQPVDDIDTLLNLVAHQQKSGDYESSIDTFSDFYHHHSTGSQDNWAVMVARYYEPKFVNQYLENLLGPERQAVLTHWMKEVVRPNQVIQDQNAYFAARGSDRETFTVINCFFRRQILSFMNNRLNAGPLIKAFVNGSGFCSIFKHPSDRTNDLDLSNEKEVKMAKLGSLIANLQKRDRDELWSEGVIYSNLFNAMRQISVVCTSFMRYPLDENNRKKFFSMLLEDMSGTEKLLEPTNTYVPGEHGDICSKLVSIIKNTSHTQKMYFFDANSTGLFLDECIDDLPKIFRFKFSRAGLDKHFGSLIDRWMSRIEHHMQQILHVNPREYKQLYDPLILAVDESDPNYTQISNARRPSIFPLSQQRLQVLVIAGTIRDAFDASRNIQFDNFIRAVADEVPSREAQKAYEKGEGLCLMVYNTMLYFKTLAEILAKYGWERSYSVSSGYLVGNNRNDVEFVRLLLLQITCQGLRNKFLLDIKPDIPDAKRRKIE